MFGKIFESLYTGSMIGAGAPVFAVWGYVIANQKPDDGVGAQVELNPKLLSMIIGEEEAKIQAAIDYLCAPDPNSRSKEQDGRRLLKLGQFDYQVVNGAKYIAIRDQEQRRQQNRDAQQRFRDKKREKGPSARYRGMERRGAKAYSDGNEPEGDRIAAEGLREESTP